MKTTVLLSAIALFLAPIGESSLAGEPPAKDSSYRISLSGYVQSRLEFDQASKPGLDDAGKPQNLNNFHVRRARLKVAAAFASTSKFILHVDAGKGSVSILDAYVDWRSPDSPVTLTFGQFKLPFGYEIPESSSEREFPERSQVINALFKGVRDRGIKATGNLPGEAAVQYQVGFFNGTGIEDRTFGWQDSNNHKDLVIHLSGKAEAVNWGTSAYIGKAFDVATQSNLTKNRYGLDAQVFLPGQAIKVELVSGKDGQRKSLGWYAQYLRQLGPNSAAVRYDAWDPNTGQPDDGVNTLGLAWLHQLDRATKVTVAYLLPQEQGAKVRNNRLTLQLQFKY